MEPAFNSGELVTALRRWRPVRRGDVVVMCYPRDPGRWLLKRCVGRIGTRLDLRGDNADASTDSREFGLVEACEVGYLVIDVGHQ